MNWNFVRFRRSWGLLHKTEKQYSWVYPAELTPVDLSSLLSVSVLDQLAIAPSEYHSHAIGSPMTGQLEPSVLQPPQTHTDTNPPWSPTGQPACQLYNGRVMNVSVCVCWGVVWASCFSLFQSFLAGWLLVSCLSIKNTLLKWYWDFAADILHL